MERKNGTSLNNFNKYIIYNILTEFGSYPESVQ
jgi:hypothetical protein